MCCGYYNITDEDVMLCEIEATGEIIEGDDKCVTNKIKIIRKIEKDEIYKLENEGKDNKGLGNTGHRNTGHRNTGNRNTGYMNTGYMNTGNRNTGNWNKTNRSSGVFCNEEPKMMMFNKKTDITYEEWENSEAYDILSNHTKSKWVWYCNMTEEEKNKYPSAEVCDGYIKEIPRVTSSEEWWNNLEMHEKATLIQLPNFNLKVFNDIMELDISPKEYNEIKLWAEKR